MSNVFVACLRTQKYIKKYISEVYIPFKKLQYFLYGIVKHQFVSKLLSIHVVLSFYVDFYQANNFFFTTQGTKFGPC